MDGYDEINENKRYEFTRLLEKMQHEYSKCIFIVSSRTYVFREDKYPVLRAGTILNLSALSKEQMYEFINKWNFKRKNGKELYHKILVSPQLDHLASNVLILTLICYMFDCNVKIEHDTIVDFYIEASKCLLESWEKDKRIQKRTELPLRVKEEALAAFAYYQLRNSETWTCRSKIVESIKECADKYGNTPDDILKEISLQASILEITPKGKYRFYHRSFYEFYAALYMANNGINLDIVENEVELHCNLISFYLSLKKDIQFTTKILHRHKDKQKFVSQIIRYCEIDDKVFVSEHIMIR